MLEEAGTSETAKIPYPVPADVKKNNDIETLSVNENEIDLLMGNAAYHKASSLDDGWDPESEEKAKRGAQMDEPHRQPEDEDRMGQNAHDNADSYEDFEGKRQ